MTTDADEADAAAEALQSHGEWQGEVRIRCSDPRLKTATVRVSAPAGGGAADVSIHTGKYLSARAHQLLGRTVEARFFRGAPATSGLRQTLAWLAAADLVDSLVSEHYPRGEAVAEDPKLRTWVYFHHLCSPAKVGYCVAWATELMVSGIVVPGQPGCLVAEGLQSDVALLVERVRLFSWRDCKAVLHTHPAALPALPWAGMLHVDDSPYKDLVTRGSGVKGRDTTNYGAMVELLPSHWKSEMLILLPVFTAGQVPEADAVIPQVAPSAAKKKKKRLQ
ncbi:hypothetical protein DIPPA_30160 [Diplonema papillatum]|nr:hypothetical protein DIPPA_30160 [Diplonema papillatum]